MAFSTSQTRSWSRYSRAYISVLRWANRTAASRARAMVNSPSCSCSCSTARGFLLLYPELVLLELAPGLGDLGLLGGYAGTARR